MADQLTQVRHAIAALYSSAGDQAAQANLFLQQVQQTEAAWHIGIQLCNVNEPTQVQFFAVSLLLRKVRTCWHATLPSTRQSLCSAFAGLFESALQCTVSTVVMRQLCLLQAAVVDEESGIAPLGLLQQAERILHTQALVALELLAAMAQESQNFGRLRRERVIKALSSRTYDVLTLLGGLISDALQAGASSASSNHNQDNNNNSASIASILIAALGAVNAWLGLTTHPGGCQIGPAELQVRYNRLFRALLWCALSPPQNDEIVSEAALQPLIAVLNSATYGTEDSHDASALNVCIEALLSVASRIDAVPEGIAAIAAQLGAAVADRWPEGAAGQLPGAEKLAQLMLMTLERPEPLVTESAIEYFLAINTVPMSQRLRQLQSPLFAELAVRLRRRASYPSDFVDSWDDYCSNTVDDAMPPTTSAGTFSGIDADAFNRLRDLTLPEALEECYGVLRAAYLEDIVSELRVAPSWQRAEACLYALGAVALSVRSRALASPDPLKDPITSRDVATTRQHLRNVLLQLVFNGGNALLGHPKLAETGCWLLEQYAVYLKADDAPLRDAVQCVLRVVRDCGTATRTTATARATRSAACRSFCALCLRCAPRLNDPVLVAELIKTVDTLREHAVVSSSRAASTPSLTSLTLSPAAAAAAATAAMPLEDEKQLMSGLTHLVAALSPEHAEIAASTLAMPLIRQVRASLDDQTGLGSPRIPAPLGSVTSGGMHIPEVSMAARTAMKRALHLLAATLKALLPAALSQQPRGDGAVLAGGPAVAVLRTFQDALQLVATTPAWQRDTEVMAALMDVYREAIASSRKRSVELLPAILPAVGAVFTSTALPSCLDVLSEAVESHFQDHQIISGLLQATHTSFEAALPLLAQSQSHRGGGSGPPHGMSPDNQVGLLAAMTNLADSFALYAPAVLWPSALLPTSLALAIVAVQTREGETLTAALSLLSHLLSGQERIADDPQLGAVDMEPLHALLMHRGESLTEALLRALCETCPRQHMRAAADRLRSLVTHRALASGAPLWFPNALRTCVSALPPPSRDAMTAELQTKVCGLVLAGALRPARLTGLLVDFGLIARREESEDALLAYEM